MIKFPYGIGDFESIITEHYFYVDRTDRIRLFEKIGKSLLLSILENYYDRDLRTPPRPFPESRAEGRPPMIFSLP